MRSALSTLPLAFVVLAGCPEPPSGTIGAEPSLQPGGSADAAAGDATGGEAVGDPAGGASHIPPGMRIEPPGFGLEKGEGIQLGGTVTYNGELDGQLRVEILQESGGDQGPSLLHSLDLDGPGEWEVTAPRDLGEVSVLAYMDLDQSGPNEGEPLAHYDAAIVIGTEDITGLSLLLLDPTAEGYLEGQETPDGIEAPPAEEGEAEHAEDAEVAPEGDVLIEEEAPTEPAPDAAPAPEAEPPAE